MRISLLAGRPDVSVMAREVVVYLHYLPHERKLGYKNAMGTKHVESTVGGACHTSC